VQAVSWESFRIEAPELAEAIAARFASTRHHVMATLRRDGSPRVSGTEVQFFRQDLAIGSMPGAVKARDLQRDGRIALHSNPGDGSMAGGDAKLSGRAVEVTDEGTLAAFSGDASTPQGPFHLFLILISEAVLTSIHPDGDRLLIESWHPGQAVRRIERH
jgi:hypothetical protein